MNIDDLDIKILCENFDEKTISQMDEENIRKIIVYLYENGVFYFKDLLLNSLDLFLLSYEEFVEKFEKLKNTIGRDYVNKLGSDYSLIDIMYED